MLRYSSPLSPSRSAPKSAPINHLLIVLPLRSSYWLPHKRPIAPKKVNPLLLFSPLLRLSSLPTNRKPRLFSTGQVQTRLLMSPIQLSPSVQRFKSFLSSVLWRHGLLRLRSVSYKTSTSCPRIHGTGRTRSLNLAITCRGRGYGRTRRQSLVTTLIATG